MKMGNAMWENDQTCEAKNNINNGGVEKHSELVNKSNTSIHNIDSFYQLFNENEKKWSYIRFGKNLLLHFVSVLGLNRISFVEFINIYLTQYQQSGHLYRPSPWFIFYVN